MPCNFVIGGMDMLAGLNVFVVDASEGMGCAADDDNGGSGGRAGAAVVGIGGGWTDVERNGAGLRGSDDGSTLAPDVAL